MANKIKYIIDYKGYGKTYDLTNTRTGEHTEITRDQAKDYVSTSPDFGNISDTYFSVKADVSIRSVDQVEVPSSRDAWFDGLINSVPQSIGA